MTSAAVFINTIQLFAGTDYRPYDLAGSGFITLTDIEGEDLPLSRDVFYSMDYISHGGTLLDPRSRHQRVMPSKSARFSPFPIACTVLDVKVKSMKG